jgi:hypothetical protein
MKTPLHILMAPLLLAAVALSCTDAGPTLPDAPFPLEPFQEMARAADCAEIRNDLVLLDGSLVLWHRQGNCADATFAVVIFGASPAEVLCVYADSIGGPTQYCLDPSLEPMLAIIVAHYTERGLGLVPPHVLERIPF